MSGGFPHQPMNVGKGNGLSITVGITKISTVERINNHSMVYNVMLPARITTTKERKGGRERGRKGGRKKGINE